MLCYSGEGVGDGPVKSVWQALTRLIVNNLQHWMAVGDGLFTPLILPYFSSPQDLAMFRTYGWIMQLGLLWNQEFLPFSPVLLLFLIDGFNSATNAPFVSAVAPECAARLSSWPPPMTTTLSGEPQLQVIVGADPMNLIIDSIPNIQVR
jgi:hypothetical protein